MTIALDVYILPAELYRVGKRVDNDLPHITQASFHLCPTSHPKPIIVKITRSFRSFSKDRDGNKEKKKEQNRMF